MNQWNVSLVGLNFTIHHLASTCSALIVNERRYIYFHSFLIISLPLILFSLLIISLSFIFHFYHCNFKINFFKLFGKVQLYAVRKRALEFQFLILGTAHFLEKFLFFLSGRRKRTLWRIPKKRPSEKEVISSSRATGQLPLFIKYVCRFSSTLYGVIPYSCSNNALLMPRCWYLMGR